MNNISEGKLTAPPNSFSLQINGSSRSTNLRNEPAAYTMADGGNDGGVSLYEPHGYYVNMSLASFRGLVAWLSAHLKYRSERFKPVGWRLVPIDTTSSPIEVREGQSVTFIGDAFIIRDQAGSAVGPAYSALEYSVEPIVG